MSKISGAIWSEVFESILLAEALVRGHKSRSMRKLNGCESFRGTWLLRPPSASPIADKHLRRERCCSALKRDELPASATRTSDFSCKKPYLSVASLCKALSVRAVCLENLYVSVPPV